MEQQTPQRTQKARAMIKTLAVAALRNFLNAFLVRLRSVRSRREVVSLKASLAEMTSRSISRRCSLADVTSCSSRRPLVFGDSRLLFQLAAMFPFFGKALREPGSKYVGCARAVSQDIEIGVDASCVVERFKREKFMRGACLSERQLRQAAAHR
jgi:hypothetical protein